MERSFAAPLRVVSVGMPLGIVPAAGAGLRLRPFRYPKELLPVAMTQTPDGIRPVLAVEFALRTLARAGCEQIVVAIHRDKLDLVRLIEDGAAFGTEVAFVVQPEPRGLTDAVQRCLAWAHGRSCVLQLPDTLFQPSTLPRDLLATGADLALGVFPTDRPEHLGPVRHEQGRVTQVQDKPPHTDLRNTWGVASWGPAFTELALQADPSEPIGLSFQRAVERGLRVRAIEGERYHDIGTARSLADLVLDPLESDESGSSP